MTLISLRRNGAPKTSSSSNEYRDFINTFSRAVGRYAKECSDNPAVNIIEEPERFRIELAAPGYTKKNFSINVEKDVLTVSANPEEKQDNEISYIHCEFSRGSFQRSFTLGKSIDATKIAATSMDGILTITLPKREEAKEKPLRIISID